MERLRIVKLSPSIVRFVDDFMMYFGSSYDVQCEAYDFKVDTSSDATLSVEFGDKILASCGLFPDPKRRGIRSGTLPLAGLSYPEGRYHLCVKLGRDVVFRTEIMAFSVAGTVAEPGSGSSLRWTIIDKGVITDSTLEVADMTQVRISSNANEMPLDIIVSSDPFEAYIVVTSLSGSFPFSDILVNGTSPVWDHKDSLQLQASEWTIHLIKIAGSVHAELRSGLAAGTEMDPDGNIVNSVEVNS